MMLDHIEKEEQQQASQSSSGKTRRCLKWGREEGHACLVRDYFSDDSIFCANTFRRHFHMWRKLFLCVVDALENHSDYFKWREDGLKRKGLSPLQKCTTTVRQLTYASPTDSLDEYIQMGEITTLDWLTNFCQCIVEVFEARYLRSLNIADTTFTLNTRANTWISWHVRESRLYALGMEELPSCLERPIYSR